MSIRDIIHPVPRHYLNVEHIIVEYHDLERKYLKSIYKSKQHISD